MQNYCEACERNKAPILEQLCRWLPSDEDCRVLEIGSGSGQHALHFIQARPNWQWQTTELPDNLPALRSNISRYGQLPLAPIALNVAEQPWPVEVVDNIFTANTLHIMSAASVEAFFTGLSGVLADNAKLIVYGPFRYQGDFTATSNARFDQWLKTRDPDSGIRDFEWIQQLALQAGLQLLEDRAMPANNQLLVWQKR